MTDLPHLKELAEYAVATEELLLVTTAAPGSEEHERIVRDARAAHQRFHYEITPQSVLSLLERLEECERVLECCEFALGENTPTGAEQDALREIRALKEPRHGE